MPLVVHNTLSRQKEEFLPVDPPKVNMYVCGITPYDETHLGHGRAYITFDIIRRYLEYSGFKVNHVQNITDIDDKIIKKASDSGKTIKEISELYTDSYFKVMDMLKVKRASLYPKATEHIKEMLDMIGELIGKAFAYVIGGDVYFSVESYPGYGKLSNRKLDDMKAGARVGIDERKKHPMDFALWKAAKEGEPSWDSPWGKGRPGWHTECVAMSRKYLGQPFDIHGGGADLMFPHHENEIAQAQGLEDKPFVKYWIHNGFVTVDKEKMSKSLGNFFTLKDIFERYDPMTVRFFLTKTHYRSPINFSFEGLDEAKAALESIKNAYEDMLFMLRSANNGGPGVKFDMKAFKDKFAAAMDDDFNSAAAVGAVFELIKFYNENKFKLSAEDINNVKNLMEEFNNILQFGIKESKVTVKDDIQDFVNRRILARKDKDWALSDKIRKEIEEKGYTVEDTPFGMFVKKKGEEKEVKPLKIEAFGFKKKG